MARTRSLRTLIILVLTASMAVLSVRALAAKPETRSFAFVARGDNPIDALAAAPIAGRLNAPVLLTPPDSLAPEARQGLLDAAPDVVVIAGGTSAVSSAVFEAIGDLLPGAEVRRVSGATRYATAEALAALVREYQPTFLRPGDAALPPETTVGSYRCDAYDFVSDALVPAIPSFTNVGDGNGATFHVVNAGDGNVYNDIGCSIHLPAGATVTDLRVLYADYSPTKHQGPCGLGAYSAVLPSVTDGPAIQVGQTADAFDGGFVYAVAQNPTPFVVDSRFAYEVNCRIWEAGYIDGLVNVEVTYEVAQVPGVPVP